MPISTLEEYEANPSMYPIDNPAESSGEDA